MVYKNMCWGFKYTRVPCAGPKIEHYFLTSRLGTMSVCCTTLSRWVSARVCCCMCETLS